MNSSSSHEETSAAAMIAWGERWLKVGPKLEAIKTKELRSFDSVKQAAAIDQLFAWGLTFNLPTRTTSGLVEFHKAMKKLHS